MVGFCQPFFGYKIVVETTTKALTLWHLTNDHLELKDLIFKLRDDGMNDPQIAKYLRQKEISTKRGKTDWQGKDVWSVRKKFGEREKKLQSGTFRFLEIKLITPIGVYKISGMQVCIQFFLGNESAWETIIFILLWSHIKRDGLNERCFLKGREKGLLVQRQKESSKEECQLLVQSNLRSRS